MFVSCISLHCFNELTGLPCHIWRTYLEHTENINTINAQIYSIFKIMMPKIHFLFFLFTSLNNKDMPCLSKTHIQDTKSAPFSLCSFAVCRPPGKGWGTLDNMRAPYRASKNSRRGATLGGQNPFKRHVFQALSFSELNGKAVLTRSLNYEKVFWILPRFSQLISDAQRLRMHSCWSSSQYPPGCLSRKWPQKGQMLSGQTAGTVNHTTTI